MVGRQADPDSTRLINKAEMSYSGKEHYCCWEFRLALFDLAQVKRNTWPHLHFYPPVNAPGFQSEFVAPPPEFVTGCRCYPPGAPVPHACHGADPGHKFLCPVASFKGVSGRATVLYM